MNALPNTDPRTKRKRFLLHAVGSHGDVLPIVELAKALQARGHEAQVFVHVIFAELVRDAGIAVTAFGSLKDQEIFRDVNIVHGVRAHRVLAQFIADTTPKAYQAMADALCTGPAVVIGNTVAFACHLLKETHAVPCVTIHYAPSVLRSKLAPARLFRHKISIPSAVWPAAWQALDRWVVDPLYATPLNQQRIALGLSPIKRVVHDWIHRADMLLGMFPDWFATPQPDWPPNLKLMGFPLRGQQTPGGLPAAITAFLEAGDPPIGFTPGTHTATASEFFEVSHQACRNMGRRGIFLTRFADQVPRALPPNIAHFTYAPFDALLPRLAAFVHHGGIGSISQAMLARVPQLIRPMCFDQFDNSSRACDLGVAKEVLAHKYSSKNVATTLTALMDRPEIVSKCADLGDRLAQTDGIQNACETILSATF